MYKRIKGKEVTIFSIRCTHVKKHIDTKSGQNRAGILYSQKVILYSFYRVKQRFEYRPPADFPATI